jgi:tetratricopeptide (TPR) repeat protein
MPARSELPWGPIAIALAAVVLLARAWGAPLGEPVADDFGFLHCALTHPAWRLFEPCGSAFYWRPLAQRGWFEATGALMLHAPLAVALLQLALIAFAAWLLHRALQPALGGVAAAAAATFTLLSESTRVLVGWPSGIQDVGALVCFCAAVHAVARGRTVLALLVALASLLCKETAALMLPVLAWVPGAPASGRMRRAAAFTALVVAWAIAYAMIARAAGLAPMGGGGDDGSGLLTDAGAALVDVIRAGLSLGAQPARLDTTALLMAAVIAVLALPHLRRATPERRAWLAFGLVWYAAGALALAPTEPDWQPYRASFAGAGLGIAAAALLAGRPLLLGAWTALRLALLFAASAAPAAIGLLPDARAASMDFVRIARLQRLVRETRVALLAAHPTLPPGAALAPHDLPHGAQHAFEGSSALAAWYGDPSLRWIRFTDFRTDTTLAPAAIVEYQTEADPPVLVLTPEAFRMWLRAAAMLEAERWEEAIVAADRADSLANEPRAVTFAAGNAYRRAYAAMSLGRDTVAIAEARRAVALSPRDATARFTVALALRAAGRLGEADAALDTLLRLSPGDADARALREEIRRARE